MGALELATAFSIGILGSVHCVGMCGPIALALPFRGLSRWQTVQGILAYNTGRIATYALLGTFIGLLGRGIWLAGWQAYLSLALGIGLALTALLSIPVESRLLRIPFVQRFHQWVGRKLALHIGARGIRAFLIVGALNGLIPCGLVYMAIAGALASGSFLSGAAFMALFGLGTVPMMALTAFAGQRLNLAWRSRLRTLAPLLILLVAAVFILRGIHFQAPDSIRFHEAWQDMPMCH
jgi:hypothetical protein